MGSFEKTDQKNFAGVAPGKKGDYAISGEKSDEPELVPPIKGRDASPKRPSIQGKTAVGQNLQNEQNGFGHSV
jgi:hypothetical protein